MKTSFKRSKTIKEYKTTYGDRLKYDITVPVGSIVSNSTALGNDDNMRFLTNFSTNTLVGYDAPMLAHDLTYYGLNIPAEFCEPYKKN